MPIFVSTCAKSRMAAAPIGNARAQIGQLVVILSSFFARIITARTITIVPIAVGKVRTSPKHRIPNATPNNGVVEVKVEESLLTVSSVSETTTKSESGENINENYVHRGIAKRSFSKQFNLSDDIIVKSADLKDGMLIVNLEREIPEEKKPRVIPIS